VGCVLGEGAEGVIYKVIDGYELLGSRVLRIASWRTKPIIIE